MYSGRICREKKAFLILGLAERELINRESIPEMQSEQKTVRKVLKQ